MVFTNPLHSISTSGWGRAKHPSLKPATRVTVGGIGGCIWDRCLPVFGGEVTHPLEPSTGATID